MHGKSIRNRHFFFNNHIIRSQVLTFYRSNVVFSSQRYFTSAVSSLFVRLLFAISPTIPLKNTDDGVRGRWDEMWGFLFRSNKETLIFVKSVSESLGSSTLNKEKTNPIRQILVMRTKPCLLVPVCPFKGALINYSRGQKSWSTFVFVGLSLNHTCPTPPPPHKLQVGRVYPESFPSFIFV